MIPGPVPPGCPARPRRQRAGDGPPALFGPAFAARPGAVYDALRAQGPAAPVLLAPGVEALLVTDYRAALTVLRDPGTFSKDARRWRALADGRVPADASPLPMMGWRPSVLFADGDGHARLSGSLARALARLDTAGVRRYMEKTADALLDAVAPHGRADLVTGYASLLPQAVIARLVGCGDETAALMAAGAAGMIDAEPGTAHRAGADLAARLGELVRLKRARPGADLTSWLAADRAGLGDEELLHQLVVLVGAGTVPQAAWISSTLWLLLADDRFGGDVARGATPVGDALDEVLWRHSPMPNFCAHYAVRDTWLDSSFVPAGVPVLVSLAAANTQHSQGPAARRAGNRAHLAWSAGPHTCPARGPARVIAEAAVERVLDRLPGLALDSGGELLWRPGPFHRALASLPVRFPPGPAARTGAGTGPAPAPSSDATARTGGTPWNSTPAPPAWTRTAPASTPRPPGTARPARPRRWYSPGRWRRGT